MHTPRVRRRTLGKQGLLRRPRYSSAAARSGSPDDDFDRKSPPEGRFGSLFGIGACQANLGNSGDSKPAIQASRPPGIREMPIVYKGLGYQC